jgi:hypothetical protein
MSRYVLSWHYYDVLGMLGVGMVVLWLWLIGVSLRELRSETVLTIDGYLRRRPDPATENALRTAFTQFDQDLAVTLGHCAAPQRAVPGKTAPRKTAPPRTAPAKTAPAKTGPTKAVPTKPVPTTDGSP